MYAAAASPVPTSLSGGGGVFSRCLMNSGAAGAAGLYAKGLKSPGGAGLVASLWVSGAFGIGGCGDVVAVGAELRVCPL